SVLADRPARRSLLTLERGNHQWHIAIPCADPHRQCIEHDGNPFEHLLIETGENRAGATRHALLARSRPATSETAAAHYRLPLGLTTAAAIADAVDAAIPLRDLQY